MQQLHAPEIAADGGTTPAPILSEQQKEQFIRDGYVVVRGLLPPDLVERTREDILAALEMDLTDSSTWNREIEAAWTVSHLTNDCRSAAVEQVAEELVGPDFLRGISYHYGKRIADLEPYEEGFIPVLTYPTPGAPGEIVAKGFHLDGIQGTYLWPNLLSLVVFAYLTDTAADGGATLVRPGSHRQVFEHCLEHGLSELQGFPDLGYAEPVALEGEAGDVIFFHYLMVHSGSQNRSQHIRVGLNTAVMPHPDVPYQPKLGVPDESWTPLDYTLRTDTTDLPVVTPQILALNDAMSLLH